MTTTNRSARRIITDLEEVKALVQEWKDGNIHVQDRLPLVRALLGTAPAYDPPFSVGMMVLDIARRGLIEKPEEYDDFVSRDYRGDATIEVPLTEEGKAWADAIDTIADLGLLDSDGQMTADGLAYFDTAHDVYHEGR